MKLPKTFFGWTNLKWFIREFAAMYSTRDSYFSKKRFESSMAFLGGYGIILYHVWANMTTITNSEILADAVVLFGVAGYTVSKIQAEKAVNPTPANEVLSEAENPPIKSDDDLVA